MRVSIHIVHNTCFQIMIWLNCFYSVLIFHSLVGKAFLVQYSPHLLANYFYRTYVSVILILLNDLWNLKQQAGSLNLLFSMFSYFNVQTPDSLWISCAKYSPSLFTPLLLEILLLVNVFDLFVNLAIQSHLLCALLAKCSFLKKKFPFKLHLSLIF